MYYSRAGLVALVFALIISLVSAVPISATESRLSSTLSPPSLDGQNLIQHARISEIPISGRMSTLPLATRLTRKQQIPIDDMDDQLVRRNIFDKIKGAFQSFGNKVKAGFQKAGNAIKKGFEKVGNAVKAGAQKVKQGFQKVGSAIKAGAQKVGGAIKAGAQKVKQGFQKVGSAIKAGAQKVGGAIKAGAQKVKQGFQKVGSAIKAGAQKVKQGFQKVGNAIKAGAQKAGAAIKKGFQKVGAGIKTAAKKVWNFAKTTGAQVAKFGLKVYQSVGEVVGHVATFIPGVGKPIQQAIHAATKIAGVISDRIPAKLSPQLQKGMDVMEKANKVMDYIPRRREFSEEEGFEQRDIGEAYLFEERDDFELENREESFFERDIIYERYDLD